MISIGLLGIGLAGCSDNASPNKIIDSASAQSVTPSVTQQRGNLDFTQVMHGSKVFQKDCASCHGQTAEGAPQWQRRNADGKYPPPPLSGTGHAWHHSKAALRKTIENGTLQQGGGMPGWKQSLSNQDIEDVIAWFQSRWPDEIYQAWERMDKEAGFGG